MSERDQLLSDKDYPLFAAIARRAVTRGYFPDSIQEGEIADLVQTVALKVVKEFPKFDPEKGKFSTFAFKIGLRGLRRVAEVEWQSQRRFYSPEDGDDDGEEIFDYLPDPAALTPETILISRQGKEEVTRGFDNSGLTPKERYIVGLRFGLFDQRQHNHAEILSMLKADVDPSRRVTEETICAVENDFIDKFKELFGSEFDFDESDLEDPLARKRIDAVLRIYRGQPNPRFEHIARLRVGQLRQTDSDKIAILFGFRTRQAVRYILHGALKKIRKSGFIVEP